MARRACGLQIIYLMPKHAACSWNCVWKRLAFGEACAVPLCPCLLAQDSRLRRRRRSKSSLRETRSQTPGHGTCAPVRLLARGGKRRCNGRMRGHLGGDGGGDRLRGHLLSDEHKLGCRFPAAPLSAAGWSHKPFEAETGKFSLGYSACRRRRTDGAAGVSAPGRGRHAEPHAP